LQEVRRAKYDLVLIEEEGIGDIGIEILKQIKKSWPDTRVIFVTEYGDMYSYLKAMNLGAYDYLNQSVEWDRLPKIIDKALLQFAA
jgi:two-component system, response regulator, stage 0 sporulation protein F